MVISWFSEWGEFKKETSKQAFVQAIRHSLPKLNLREHSALNPKLAMITQVLAFTGANQLDYAF